MKTTSHILLLIIVGFFTVITKAQTTSTYNEQSLNKEALESSNIFRIVVNNNQNLLHDETVIAFFASASDAFDLYDSEKMFALDDNFPQTYTLTSDGEIVVINGESNLSPYTERIIPLGFHADIAGTFAFTATNLASFDTGISVYLEDLQENTFQDLKINNIYEFISGIADNATRFRLHFITPTTIKLVSWTGSSKSTEWSDALNWSNNIVPAATDNVYIASDVQIHVTNSTASPAICNDLNIYNGATLTIDATKALTVGGKFTNNGTFYIKSDATGTGSFIDNADNSGSGTFNVEKYLTNGRWWYLGAPLSNATAAAFGTLSSVGNSGNRLYYWNETTHTYTNVTNTGDAMPAHRGYTFKSYDASPLTTTFTGNLNTGTIGTTSDLTYTSGTSSGFNLVSNPYPSAIDLGTIASSPGVTMNNLDPTFWFRSNSNFSTYNWTSGVGSPGTTTQYVPAMQGFWVRVSPGYSTGGLQLSNSARVHDSHAFYKTSSESNVFRIQLKNDSLNDETVVTFFSDASVDLDPFDSEKMFSTDDNYPQVYTLTTDNTIVAINGLPELLTGTERIIQLGFHTNTAGSFTLQATNMSDFDPNITVYLEDTQLNYFQELNIADSYTFTSGITDDVSRFKLHFGSILTGISSVSENMVSVYAFENSVYVNNLNNGMVEIYNTVGEKITQQQTVNGLNKIQLNLSKGIYIVKVLTGADVVTEKIFIGN
jgi:hypothetical protein